MNEERRGGNKFDMLAHEADIAEMIKTKTNSGNLSYEVFFDDNARNKLSVYASAQEIKRNSYYGANQDPNAYGFTKGLTTNIGAQMVSRFGMAIFAPSVMTFGVENTNDNLNDNKLGANGTDNTLVALKVLKEASILNLIYSALSSFVIHPL